MRASNKYVFSFMSNILYLSRVFILFRTTEIYNLNTCRNLYFMQPFRFQNSTFHSCRSFYVLKRNVKQNHASESHVYSLMTPSPLFLAGMYFHPFISAHLILEDPLQCKTLKNLQFFQHISEDYTFQNLHF